MKAKIIYGGIEIIFSVITFGFLATQLRPGSEISVVVGYVGAIYVFVRGLVNVEEGWPGRPAAASKATVMDPR